MRLSSDGVVHQVPGGEVVGPVHDQVVAVDDVEDVVGAQPHVVGHHVDVGVERGERLLGRVDLAFADAVHGVQDLALEVRGVHHVHVHDADRAHPGRRQVQRGGRTQAARTEEQHLRVEQLELALLADLGHEEVALVSVALVGREGLRGAPRAALVLPAVEPADKRHHVGVAEIGHGLGGEGGAHPGGAVDHDGRRLVGEPALDLELEMSPRQVDGAGDGALLVLVGFADVEEHDRTQPRLDLVGRHLGDGRFGLLQQISGSGHLITTSLYALSVRGGSAPRRWPPVVPPELPCVTVNLTSGVDIPG